MIISNREDLLIFLNGSEDFLFELENNVLYTKLLVLKRRICFMNILVLGATGRVGSHIVSYSLNDKHNVTVLVRTPKKIQIKNKNLIIIQGNVLNKKDIVRAICGSDIVISALNTDGTTTLSESIPLIIKAMENEGVKRIITIGTAGILQSRITPSLLRYQSSESRQKSTRAAKEHHKVYEMLKQSSLDWTIVCPTYLSEGERVGKYRIKRDYLPEGGVKISMSDTAEFTFKQIRNSDYIKERVGIAY